MSSSAPTEHRPGHRPTSRRSTPACRSPPATSARAADDQAKMLAVLGLLARWTTWSTRRCRSSVHSDSRWRWTAGRAEPEVIAELRALAARNTVLTSMIGLGYYGTDTPPVIRRNVLENPAWYTAYTPYQPEITQGRLEALLNFQTVVTDLTGLPVQRLDAGRGDRRGRGDDAGAADQQGRRRRGVRRRRRRLPADPGRGRRPGPSRSGSRSSSPTCTATGCPTARRSGCCCSTPATRRGPRPVPGRRRPHRRRRLVAVAADLLALTLLRPPGEMGADIAVGTTQRFGVPMGFGGPHAGYMSVRAGSSGRCPAAWSGCRVDADGAPAYRLALQTREQHIRREKATSNICTAQVLLAVIAAMYAVYHGPEGLARSPGGSTATPPCWRPGSRRRGVEVVHDAFFDTVLLRAPGRAGEVVAAARSAGVNLRLVDDDHVGISIDETTTREQLRRRLGRVRRRRRSTPTRSTRRTTAARRQLRDDEPYLTHPVFHAHRSETAMLRYLRRLVRPGLRAGPRDDPARLVHDEAQRDDRDGADHLAGVRRPAPVRAGRAGRGLHRR